MAAPRRAVWVVAAWVFGGAIGCAGVRETRTRLFVDTQSQRVSEERRPDLWRARAEPRFTGNVLQLQVVTDQYCVVQFAERLVVRERVQRIPDASVMGLEVLGVGVGAGAALYGARRAHESSGPESLGAQDFVGVAGIFVAVASGVAVAIDARKSQDFEVEKTIDSPGLEQRVERCSFRAVSPRSVELTTTSGRRFVSSIDGRGIARFFIPDDFWTGGATEPVEVRVDGRQIPSLVLQRGR